MARPNATAPVFGELHLSQEQFGQFRALMSQHCGLMVADQKRLMLQNRIGKRVRALGMAGFAEYYQHLRTAEGTREELQKFWGVVTTHETHFFREAHHFDTLAHLVVPRWVARSGPRMLRVWSAGCSTGQEPYTLAMVLGSCFGNRPDWSYRIHGTDIDASAIEVAKAGRYSLDLRSEVPGAHLVRSFETEGKEMVVRAHLRARLSFAVQNFATVEPARPRYDLIFCRNAMMYLDLATRERLVGVFRDSLQPGGCLIVGTTETLHAQRNLFVVERDGRTTLYGSRL